MYNYYEPGHDYLIEDYANGYVVFDHMRASLTTTVLQRNSFDRVCDPKDIKTETKFEVSHPSTWVRGFGNSLSPDDLNQRILNKRKSS